MGQTRQGSCWPAGSLPTGCEISLKATAWRVVHIGISNLVKAETMTTTQAYSNYMWRRMAYEARHNRPATRFAPPVKASKRTMFGALVAAWDLLTSL